MAGSIHELKYNKIFLAWNICYLRYHSSPEHTFYVSLLPPSNSYLPLQFKNHPTLLDQPIILLNGRIQEWNVHWNVVCLLVSCMVKIFYFNPFQFCGIAVHYVIVYNTILCILVSLSWRVQKFEKWADYTKVSHECDVFFLFVSSKKLSLVPPDYSVDSAYLFWLFTTWA